MQIIVLMYYVVLYGA